MLKQRSAMEKKDRDAPKKTGIEKLEEKKKKSRMARPRGNFKTSKTH